tara:strand:+ start:83439 stop:85955 length:2517 start_codon:yes stop_codon:yes gene_type:complete
VIKKLLLLFCLLAATFVKGQEQIEKPLLEVLDLIEQRFNARFSYLDDDVKGISVGIPGEELRLRESILFLKQRTPLDYTFINDNQIAISAQKYLESYCGLITDMNMVPIRGAKVSTSKRIVETDAFGFFSIPFESAEGIITISSQGYQTVQQIVNRPTAYPCPIIPLTREIIDLNEVVITDYITKGINRERDGRINIDFTEVGLLPGVIESDVLLAIQALPGIQSVNERVSDLNIRGGSQDQNLILWDGIKMYQSGHFFGLISSINPNITEKVRLYKNGTPAAYSDGVSGTIAMQSQQTLTQEVKAQIDVNLINYGGFIDVPISEKSSVQISARKSFSDLLETLTYREYFNRVFQDTEVIRDGANTTTETDEELFSFFDTSVRWLYQPTERDKIQINGLIVNNEISFRETAFIDGVRERQRSSASQDNLAAGISYERDWNDTFSTLAQVYLTNYTLEGTNFDLINSFRLIQTNDVLENAVRLEGAYRDKDLLKLRGGYQFIETGITNIQDLNNPLFRQSIKEVIRAHAIYGSLNYTTPNGRSEFIAGIRGQYYDKLDVFRLEPRLNYSYLISKGLTIDAAGEMKSQATSQTVDFQSDFLGIESRRWVLANNESVPLITSVQASGGLTYDNRKWLISGEGYFKQVEGITVQSQGFQNQLQFVQGIGNYETMGIDLLVHKRWEHFNFRTGYTYAVNSYSFDNLPNNIKSDFHNNVDVRHIIKTAFSYTGDHLQLALGVNWHTGKPTTTLVAGNEVQNNGLNYNTPNNSHLTEYIRFDISGTYDFSLGKKTVGELGISIWNLLNNNNVVNQYFLLSEDTPNTLRERALRFTPNLSFKIRYN